MRELGKSGIMVAPVALGTWAVGGGPWWGANDDTQSIDAICAALDNGINMIDTAPSYYFGHSEEVVGRAIKGRREKVVLATKCGLVVDGTEGSVWYEQEGHQVRSCLIPSSLRREVECSLKRLGTDYIDLYQVHFPEQPPLTTPITDSMAELMRMKAEGKIRAIGISNMTAKQIGEWSACGDLATCQNKYSILDRVLEDEVQEHCVANNVGILAYSPLEQGLLTGKIREDTPISATSFRNAIPWYKPELKKRVIAMVDGWHDLTEKYNCTTAQLVIAWTVAQRGMTAVLCGARKVKNAIENAAALKVQLEAADIARMRRDAEGIK